MWRKIELFFLILATAGLIMLGKNLSQLTGSENISPEKKVIVLDAGHGGSDPGKVGINQALEKEINLQIAEKLKVNLEKRGIEVIMTREDDNLQKSKTDDMKERVGIINDVVPEFAVSIHQNSYLDSSVSGAQVFYYTGSKEGEEIAKKIQESLWEIEGNKKREVKGNDSYYLLKYASVPMVIIECGFLSNPEEANRLVTERYQEEISNAIGKGIESCFGN